MKTSVALVQKIERLLVADYRKTAFHNLMIKTKRTVDNLWLGGTCSDKTLHFKAILEAEGIQAQLHTAEIAGIACHRLLSINLQEKKYFIDAGSGWPCIQLFPAFEDSNYTAFGIEFRAKQTKLDLIVQIKTSTEFKPFMIIPLQEQSQTVIEEAIANRFHPSNVYPFQYGLYLSFVKDDQFYFLKGNQLRVYKNQATYTEQQLKADEIQVFIATHFPQLTR